MNAFDLVATLTLDKKGYEDGLKDAGSEAGNASGMFGGKLAKGLKAATVGFAALAAATVATIGYLKKATSEVAEHGDRIDKMSQKMNMSTTAFQEWDFVLEHCGTSIESMKAPMKTLATAAENGNKAFERLGITQEQIASMNQEQLFAATIKGLQQVTDDTERTYLAGQLLGRGATELGALLNMSAEETEAMKNELHELGGVMSEDAVKAAAAYQDSVQNLGVAMEALKVKAISEFLPGFTQVMDGLSMLFSGQDGGVEMIGQGMENIVNTIADAIPRIADFISEMAPEIGSALATIVTAIIEAMPTIVEAGLTISASLIVAIIEGLSQAAGELFSAASQMIQANVIEPIKQKLQEMKAAVQSKFQEAANSIRSAWNNVVSFFQGIIDGIKAVFQPIISFIQSIFGQASSSATSAWSGVVGFFSGIVSGIVGVFSGIGSTIAGFFRSAATMAISAFTSIVGRVRGIANSIVSTFSGLPGRFFSIGSHIVSNLINGLLSGLGRLKSAAAQLSGVLSIFKHSVPTTGPFAHDDQWMYHFAENLATGLLNGKPLVEDAAWQVAEGITVAIISKEAEAFLLGQETLMAYIDGMGMTAQAKAAIRQVREQIQGALSEQISFLNKQISDMEAREEQENYERELKEYQQNLADKKKKLAEAEVKDRQSIQDEITKLEEDWRQKELDRERKATKERLELRIQELETLQDEYNEAMENIESAESKMSDKLKDYGKLFETVHDELRDKDVFGLTNLQEQIDAINHYGEALEQLRQRGVTDSLMDEIVSLGIEDATAYADKLLWLSDEYFDQYIQKWEEKQQLAEQIASTFYAPDKSEVNTEYLDKFNSLLTETDRGYIDLKLSTERTAGASAELKKAIDEESTSYVALQKQLQKTIALQRELNSVSSGSSVGFSESAIAKTTEASINARVTPKGTTTVNVTGNIVAPDGKALASYMLNDLTDVAKANGTPIVNKK